MGRRTRGEHLARLDAEIDNLHAALGWAVGQASAELALAMARRSAATGSCETATRDAVDWIDQALSLPGADAHPALRVRALSHQGDGLWPLGRGAEQSAILAEAEAIARELGDPADPVAGAPAAASTSEAALGRLDVADRARRRGASLGARGGRRMGDRDGVLAQGDGGAHRIAELRERVDRAASLLSEAGNVFELASLLGSAAYRRCAEGSDRDAKEFTRLARLPIARELDDPFTGWSSTATSGSPRC